MDLIKAIETYKGNPVEIPDVDRTQLPKLYKHLGYKVGAEIGVYKGAFTKLFAEEGFKIYAIDPWMAFSGQGRTLNRKDRQNFLFEHTSRLLKPYSNALIIRQTSMDALQYFDDGSLDFVYIDGDHDFRHIAEDIFEWSKKVRKGGMVSGHDYFSTHPKARNTIVHVAPIIDSYTKLFKVENVWTLGRDFHKNNKAMSWLFIK